MDEKIVRGELPVQSIHERGEEGMNVDDLTATVPVHRKILSLPPQLRTNQSLLTGAIETVRGWFNEDMAYHLSCLEAGGTDPSLVGGYEKFRDDWILEWVPDNEGYLALVWKDGNRIDRIGFCKVPVLLYNQLDENREFYTPERAVRERWIECVDRGLRHSEVVFMGPEKMRAYGVESRLAEIDTTKGVAEVTGYAFCSDYQPHMGKALLLRNFAVFYLNTLLDMSNEG